MRLSELEPKWCSDADGRHGMGLSFLCPVHRTHRLVVGFTVPVDGGTPMNGYQFLWDRKGDTFDTLTLGPSVDASGARHYDNIKTPCWHGFITNGEIC